MSNDILESVSQRGYGAYDAENRRIKEISDELQRLCRLHEAQPRAGQEDRGRFRIVFGDEYIPISDSYKDDVQQYFDEHTLV
jgi:hypothetical protein